MSITAVTGFFGAYCDVPSPSRDRAATIVAMNPADVDKITRGEIEHILRCLRFIDQAGKALAAKGPGNEEIIAELRGCADGISGIVRQLPRVD